jgi:hypothetical protein
MVFLGTGELQWDDLFGHTDDNPGWRSLYLESADLERCWIWTMEQYDVLQHDHRRPAGCGYVGHSHGKRWDEPQPDLHLESGDGLYLVSTVSGWSERERLTAMVLVCSSSLQWDNLFGHTGNSTGRRDSLHLEGNDLQLIREWTVEQHDVLQHLRFRTAGCSYVGYSYGNHRDELQPDLHLEPSYWLYLVSTVCG